MRRIGRVGAVAVVMLALGMAWGCGSAPRSRPASQDERENLALVDIGEAYRASTLANKRAPARAEDLVAVEMLCPTGVRAMKAGEVVVRWGANLPDTGEEPGKVPSPEVLAYAKRVPEEGGPVLLLDRTVKTMTADEFKAAPKAGK